MRFVKEKPSSRENDAVTYRRLFGLALLLAVLVSIPVVFFVFKPFAVMSFRVDPELYSVLSQGRSSEAYVSVKGHGTTVLGVKVLKKWVFGDLTIVKTVLSSSEELDRLVENPDVVSVYGAKTFHYIPMHYLDPSKYPFREFDADNRLHEAYGPWTGRNVTVAVIDTGIDYTHPDFYDENNRSVVKVLVSVLYRTAGADYIYWIPYKNGSMNDLLSFDMELWRQYGEPAFLDINGHGTHVAGIIAGRGWASNGKYKGIAPGSSLVIIKAFDRYGSAGTDSCLTALEWIYNNTEKYGIDILSLSWGALYASDGHDPLSLAVDKIYLDKKVWVFVAAGNVGNYPTTVTVPAVAEYAVSVGAWDPYNDMVAPFSSLGPTIDMRMKPDMMGAGVMVVSCRSRYVMFPNEYMVGDYYVALSGTSMATPVVAGVAADYIEYYMYWNNGRKPSLQDFVKWTEENGRRINPFVKDFITGWGIPVAPHG